MEIYGSFWCLEKVTKKAVIFVLFYILCAVYQLFLYIHNLIALVKRITFNCL